VNRGEGGADQPAIGDRNRHIMDNYGNKQKSRNFEKLGDNLGSNVICGDSTIKSFAKNSRPTRAIFFKLIAGNLALRIFKLEEGKRYSTWIKTSNLNKDGLFNEVVGRPIIPPNNNESGLGKAHLAVWKILKLKDL